MGDSLVFRRFEEVKLVKSILKASIKIAKTGSLCCVAARPHGSNVAGREWSIGPHEPYWQTNTSFSPPPPRWDFDLQSEGTADGLHDSLHLYGSSTLPNSRGSRIWVRGNHISYHHQFASDIGRFPSSPDDISPGPQWTPSIQEISGNDYDTAPKRGSISAPIWFTPSLEGTSTHADTGASSSDSGESEPTVKSQLPFYRNFSSRRFFMSKPIHPLSLPSQTPSREASNLRAGGPADFEAANPQRDINCWSSTSSSADYTDVAEPLESEFFGQSFSSSEGSKCLLCNRLLSQRSPWGVRRIVSGDMPITSVLSCHHVFHAECLDNITPKTHKSDPPCPLCVKWEEENSSEQRSASALRNGFPKCRPFGEDGPSRLWSCRQGEDCVDGALHAPSRNAMLSLNRNCVNNKLYLKGNSGKDFPGKLRKSSGSYSPQLFGGSSIDRGMVGCSKAAAGLSMKRL